MVPPGRKPYLGLFFRHFWSGGSSRCVSDTLVSEVWFTSDLHIGHMTVAQERARATGVILPRYVGAEVDWQSRFLALQWDDRVAADDVVWVLGDRPVGRA